MPELSERILNRVERKFNSGENHFAARGILASIALGLVDTEVRHDTLLDTNERIVRFLRDHQAEGVVYAVRQDLGNGDQDSTDFVHVKVRDGIETGVGRSKSDNETVIIRADTAEIDY